MDEKRYNLFNNVIGWIVFAVAAFTYLSTIEPTASLWDCGEFISASYKLQVVHPPGAPFFLMLNRFFTLFAPGKEWVARFVNSQSALSSALTILFLFWTITAFARKLIMRDMSKATDGKLFSVMGAGMVGALAFTFTDSFWFSAVEGEVYALSICFMALIFWLMTKWEYRADEPGNLRWLLLILFLLGLSIGVHLLSLLVIPVLAFIYYFRKTEKVTYKGLAITAIVGLLILAFFLQIVIKTIPYVASKVELAFVNGLGLPFWSGIFFTIFVLFAGLVFGIIYSIRNHKPVLNIAFTGALLVLIAYSSYAMVVIRSIANPPIDMNNPENVFQLISYLNREQYGDRPLLYGPYFTADVIANEEGEMQYREGEHKYIPTDRKIIPKYDPSQMTIFPRMGDFRGDRKQAYRQWENIPKGQKPTFADNIGFFFSYQLGHMYWRYFAWNFIGRQNDEQGFGGPFNGNWISGFTGIDQTLAGVAPEKDEPHWMKVNKAKNKLYFLPFILGLLGIFFQFKRSNRQGFLVLAFFIMTGVALIIYSNQPPIEPRERDYVLVGSFYAYSIWIGFGVLQIIHWLRNKLTRKISAVVATGVGLLAAPVLMSSQEWNDHDRSERYTTRDYGENYLTSCDSNAVLFTNGDNDTYPLWYAQEVEGFRTDVRIINMQLFMTDWYVDQLRKKINNSPGMKFSIPTEKIVMGTRDYAVYRNNPSLNIGKNQYVPIKELVDFIASDDPRTKLQGYGNNSIDYFPSKKVKIPVNKKNALKYGIVSEKYKDSMVNEVFFNLKKNTIMKSDIMLMDFIATTDWTRPIFFSLTSSPSVYLNMGNYLEQTGLAYKLTPVKSATTSRAEPGWVDVDVFYDNLVNKFKWGDLDKKELYVDNVTRRHANNYRNLFARLGKELLKQGKKDSAVTALDKCLEVIPDDNVPYGVNIVPLLELYYEAGALDKAKALSEKMYDIFSTELEYYMGLDQSMLKSAKRDIQIDLYGLNTIAEHAKESGQDDLAEKANAQLEKAKQMFGGGL